MTGQGHREALELFAALADDRRSQGRTSVLDVSGRVSEWQWEGLRHAGLFYQEWYRPLDYATVAGADPALQQAWQAWSSIQPSAASNSTREPVEVSELPSFRSAALSDRKKGHRLDAVDRLRRHEEVLRAGWMWLTGTTDDPETGRPRVVCCPLLTVPVRMVGYPPMAMSVAKVGDVRLHPLLSRSAGGGQDLLPIPYLRARSALSDAGWPSTQPKVAAVARRMAAEIGVEVDEVLASTSNPRGRRTQPGVALVPGVGIYVDPHLSVLGTGDRLRNWANDDRVFGTAFHRMYGDDRGNPSSGATAGNDGAPHPTRALNRDQRRVLDLARTEPLLALTGPPGTGKTHVLCEVALDAIGRGQSVLIGAKSSFAVEVLARQLALVDGPVPVLFGGSQSGTQFASRMSDLLALATRSGGQFDPSRAAEAFSELSTCYRRISERAAGESLVRDLADDPDRCRQLQSLLEDNPGLIEGLGLFIENGQEGLGGWWQRRRTVRSLGLSPAADAAEASALRSELEAWRRLARADAHHRGVGLLGVSDDVDVRLPDDHLLAAARQAEERWWGLNATWLRSVMLERLSADRRGREVLQRIATATRLGRAERRSALEQIDAEALSSAAPLWLGTVGDIDDVLPSEAAMFDVVILDEASQINQPEAAGALLRASRAVVCGDPRQLRHSSAIGDEGRSVDGVVDVGRDSVFDRTVGAAPLISLSEHYRSAPHLIDFSARRFYNGGLEVATRTPATDSTDLINVEMVDGTRDSLGVNHREIEAVLRLLRDEPISHGGTIGIVTPFPAQAEAMTDAVIEQVRPIKIENRGIEVGTVHAFQGAEFDTVIASWVLDAESPAGAWAFLNDPSLFNVMVTRARRRMTVVTSVASPAGLAGDYLRYADDALHRVTLNEAPLEPWTADVVSVLQDIGLEVETGYRVGRFILDAVVRNRVGPNGEPVAVCCWPGDDHVERELQLHRLGWHVVYAFRGDWSGRLARLAIELTDGFKPIDRR